MGRKRSKQNTGNSDRIRFSGLELQEFDITVNVKAPLQVAFKPHYCREPERDIAAGWTRDVLTMDISSNVFTDSGDDMKQTKRSAT